MKEIVKLAVDSYFGRAQTQYSNEDISATIREALIQANGGNEKIDYFSFMKHPEMYQIISEILNLIITEGIQNQFEDFVDIRNIGWGDKPIFEIPDPSLFRVSVVSDSNGNLKRQRLDSTSLTVSTSMKGVKIYEDFGRFMAGRINWNEMIDRVGKSFLAKIRGDIYKAISDSFNTIDTNFKATTTSSTTGWQDTLDNIITKVEASSNYAPITIYGTRKVVSKLVPDSLLFNESMKAELLQKGYLGQYKGAQVVMIRQAFTPGTYNFAIDDTMLLIVPQVNNQKIVMMVNEGDAIVRPDESDMDLSPTYLMLKKYGVAAIAPMNYGIVKVS